jgi:hypothetical protein
MNTTPAVGDSSILSQERDREASRRAVEVSKLNIYFVFVLVAKGKKANKEVRNLPMYHMSLFVA